MRILQVTLGRAFLLLMLLCARMQAATVVVSAGQDLSAAIQQANGGDIVEVAAGTYGELDIDDRSFTAQAPLIIRAADPLLPPAIKRADTAGGEAMAIRRSRYLVLQNLVFEGAMFGLWIEECEFVIVTGCEIRNTGQEGCHIWKSSRHIDLIGNHIHHTGIYNSQWGEGIYVGTGNYSSKPFPDNCEYIWIEENLIHNCGHSEAVNVKGECFHVIVRGNTI